VLGQHRIEEFLIYQGLLVMELKPPFFPSGTIIGIGAEEGK
jgi:hypothetical protein